MTWQNSETQFKQKVVRDLKTLNECYFIKTQERARKGVPDLFICYRGLFIAIELKKETGEATILQLDRLKRIRDAKGVALVTYPSCWEKHFETLKALRGV